MIDDKMPGTGWILNLRMSGSISTNKVEKAVSWNVGPHGYKGSKEEIKNIFEQAPSNMSPGCTDSKKKENFC